MKRSRLIRLLQRRPRTAEWWIRQFGLRAPAVRARLGRSGADLRYGWPTKAKVRKNKAGSMQIEGATFHLQWWIPGPGALLRRELAAWGLTELDQHPQFGGLEDVKYIRRKR